MTITGFEPAGGCTVRVSCISAIAVPAANATLHHCAPNSAKNSRPTKDAMKCPAITLRGCENGLSGKPNTKTQVAPNEPNIKLVCVDAVRYATTPMAKHPPIQEMAICLRLGLGGWFALPSKTLKSNLKKSCLLSFATPWLPVDGLS